jgi:HPP family
MISTGATALLAAINPDIRRIGWFYIPVVLMVSTIAIFVALFTNNMQRQYPTFWWAPDPPPSSVKEIEPRDRDLEKGMVALPTSPTSPSPFDSALSTPVGSEPPTPTDSTVVSRRASFESFHGLKGCHARSLEKELAKHVDDQKASKANL